MTAAEAREKAIAAIAIVVGRCMVIADDAGQCAIEAPGFDEGVVAGVASQLVVTRTAMERVVVARAVRGKVLQSLATASQPRGPPDAGRSAPGLPGHGVGSAGVVRAAHRRSPRRPSGQAHSAHPAYGVCHNLDIGTAWKQSPKGTQVSPS